MCLRQEGTQNHDSKDILLRSLKYVMKSAQKLILLP